MVTFHLHTSNDWSPRLPFPNPKAPESDVQLSLVRTARQFNLPFSKHALFTPWFSSLRLVSVSQTHTHLEYQSSWKRDGGAVLLCWKQGQNSWKMRKLLLNPNDFQTHSDTLRSWFIEHIWAISIHLSGPDRTIRGTADWWKFKS